MSKKTRRMKRAAEEKINRKDAAIRQHNEELENLKEQYEGLDICDEDKKVIDNYIACKDARAERMEEKLYEKGMKKPVTIADGSALVTGLLLAMNMQSLELYWLSMTGTIRDGRSWTGF